MVQCTSCGVSQPDDAPSCANCRQPLATNAIAPSETVAMRPSSSVSRINTFCAADEGRFLPGTLLAGRYRVIGMLGRGGMGEVYRATDLTLAQSVAIKILPETAAANQRLLERFHNEVRIARQVSHPNVCRVYDIGEAEGLPFLSMEYVDGEDLASLFQRIGRLPSDKALEISRKLCAGLAAAHERGVMHRDLKPNNIMLDKRGQVVIMDFGLAAVADQLRGPEARNGTPAYMAPEQLRGDSVTAKSDIYALGLIIYELFTGRRAFEANSIADLLRQQETTRPISMLSLAADVDPAVGKIIQRCLRPDPADRPATPLAVAAALPGGDPLAAALAAGETPSPELVAASGKTEGFPLRYAIPCLVFCLISLIALPFLKAPMSMLAMTPVDFPPAVLEQKARDIAATFGYPEKPVDSHAWFAWNHDLVDYFKGRAQWGRDAAAAPPVTFFYRQSPDYLASPPDGEINANRPAPTLPGMFTVSTDSKGRLLDFRAVPPRFDTGAALQTGESAAFSAAGLDPAQFQEVPPVFTPPTAFDTRRAWTGPYPGLPQTAVTLEQASFQGKLTSLRVRWPWEKPVNEAPKKPTPTEIGFEMFTAAFIATGILSAWLVARRNLRLGRGDRQGAFRVSVNQLIIYVVICIPTFHVIPRMAVLGYAVNQLSFGLAMSGLLWLIYIAVEPSIRARWPHSLITWNRLLNGQLGDPRLGSHILLGVTLGLGFRMIFILIAHANSTVGRGGAPQMSDLDILFGVGPMVNLLANTAWNAILTGVVIFFLLSGLRALLRNEWAAAAAAALILTLQNTEFQNSKTPLVDFSIDAFLFASFAVILLRMGLVPIVIAVCVINITGTIPIGGEFGAWFNYITVLELSLIGCIAVFGFQRSQSARLQGLNMNTV